MKKSMMAGLLAFALSGLTTNACLVQVRIACPNDTPASGVEVCIDGVGCATTDNLGIASIAVPAFDTYTVCVTASTLPAGAKLTPLCQKIKVVDDAPPLLTFTLSGDICSTPPPQGECWLTGGGTVGKTQGVPNYSFGGVVYPGCSPNAADGGNRLPWYWHSGTRRWRCDHPGFLCRAGHRQSGTGLQRPAIHCCYRLQQSHRNANWE
jgi:hypothetical protein